MCLLEEPFDAMFPLSWGEVEGGHVGKLESSFFASKASSMCTAKGSTMMFLCCILGAKWRVGGRCGCRGIMVHCWREDRQGAGWVVPLPKLGLVSTAVVAAVMGGRGDAWRSEGK